MGPSSQAAMSSLGGRGRRSPVRLTLLAAVLLVAVLGAVCSSQGGRTEAPGAVQSVNSGGPGTAAPAEGRVDRTPFLLWPLRGLIRRHRAVGTHLDGNRCPMYPSCASYGEDALRTQGFVGLLLLIDRLFYREVGQMESKYLPAPRRLSGHRRYYDPLADTSARPSLLREAF